MTTGTVSNQLLNHPEGAVGLDLVHAEAAKAANTDLPPNLVVV